MKFAATYLLVLFLGISVYSTAQNNTNSPYSKFGLGDFETPGFGRNAALGGSGIALQSGISLNELNPASYMGLDSLLVLMELGIHSSYVRLKTSASSSNQWNANFSYLGLGFRPRSKWAMTLGYAPYTNVGYTIQTMEYIDGSLETYQTTYEGIGGLTMVYWGNAFQITKSTSIGVKSNFIFGPKTANQTILFNESPKISILKKVSSNYHGWKFDLGLQQNITINSDHKFTLGVVANVPGIIKNKNTILVTKTFVDYSIVDTLDYSEKVAANVSFPVNFGVGVAYYYRSKYLLTADYRLDRWSQMKIADKYSDLIDNQQLSLGVEYAPEGFLGRYAYRLGFNYQSGYFDVNGTKLSDYNITAGVALPMPATQVNIYASYGWRGTDKSNLILENYARLGVNLTLMDRWFQKRKYR